MLRDMQRHLAANRLVEIIYLDRHGRTTKRTVRLREISNGRVKAYCFALRAFRVFAVENILAVAPAQPRKAV